MEKGFAIHVADTSCRVKFQEISSALDRTQKFYNITWLNCNERPAMLTEKRFNEMFIREPK